MYSPEFFLMQGANGLIMGCLYALMALGLTLIFSVLKVINFAHGEFYMIGGYTAYFLVSVIGGVNPLVGVIFAMAVLLVIGSLFEASFLRPIHLGSVDRPAEYAILVTFGLSFFLQNLVLALAGPFPHRTTSFMSGGIKIGYMTLSADRLIAAGLSLVLMAGLLLFVRKTWTGKAMRAVSQDKDAASVAGINPLWMNNIAFAIGAALAGASGALIAPIFSVVPDVGVLPSLRAYIIVVLGGMGSIKGAIIGGIVIGLVESLGAALIPDPSRALAYRELYGLIIFVLVLLFRPRGLFGEAA
ncbi:MAG: branched-chain amino acid ABC transporter permease [Candidatus Bipolaricaulota bacterium]|nr:branched-chain amino acid ABC transporter permease [Candidatus Bipolaricaulota bacterium]